MFEGTSCKLTNCTLKNLKGKGTHTTSIGDYGVKISTNRVETLENYGNTYENCDIIVTGQIPLSQSMFNDCYIYLTISGTEGTTTELNRCNFNNGTIKSYSVTRIEGCTASGTEFILANAGSDCTKVIKDSTLEGIFTTPSFPEGSTCDNSTIIANNQLSNTVFNNVRFSNGCKLVLNANSSSSQIKNKYSVLGTDYTVQYMPE